MGRVCSTNGVEEECIRVWVGRPEGKRPLERQRVCGHTILKWILER
jgi:hypothetical protein